VSTAVREQCTKQFIPECLRIFCCCFLSARINFIYGSMPDPHKHFNRSLANNFSKVEALDINQLIDLLIS